MRYLIIYDISDDNVRDAIAKRLLEYGLTRIQYSSFIGDLPRFRLHSLLLDLHHILKDSIGDDGRKSIIIYPLCDSCYSKGLMIDDTSKGIKHICDANGKKRSIDNQEGDGVTVI
ncbi:CRISPR-associated endoribonuclease Cas2 [archaeon HR04]|nr:CRISPR-associated endoribonuclease Cas2 [archaeon HR04]